MAFLMRRLPKKPLSEILLGQARTAADPPTAIARSAPAMATSTWFTAPGMLAYLSAQPNTINLDMLIISNLEDSRRRMCMRRGL